jgi:dihydrodipicolinate synthase/N-acetylneuraminate lyase
MGADSWDATETVDLDESGRLVEALIGDGVAGLICLGTTGECATLTDDEFQNFVACVLATVGRRVPCFIGTTALGTHAVIQRIRFSREQGADGTLLGLPMWQPLTAEMAVRYYASISEAFPDFAIMAYANARAFRFGFDAAFWGSVAAEAPTVMSAKFSNAKVLVDAIDASGGQINFVPIDSAAFGFYQLSPETTTACWATAASMGPQPSIALMNAILQRDDGRVEAVARDIAWASEPVDEVIGNPELFASYNIQFEKARIEASGYCRPGPVRPPYDVIPSEMAEKCRENARRWVELCDRYATA